MPTHRLAHAIALAALVAACGDRATTTPAAAPVEVAAAPSGPPPETASPAAAAAAPAGSTTAVPTAPGAAVPAVAAGSPPVDAQGAAAAPAPTPVPVATVIKEAVAVEPAGAVLPLTRERDTVIDPGARFEVVLSVASPDARLVLIDYKDALVAGAEAHEVGQVTRLTLAPTAPLTPGRRYTLRVDGAATRELHDAGGKAFTPSVLTIRVAGATLPEPKDPAARRKRRR